MTLPIRYTKKEVVAENLQLTVPSLPIYWISTQSV